MSYFGHLGELERLRIWNEQIWILTHGSLTFTIGGEVRELRPGATWVIPSDVPHSVRSGPDGASLVELFAPPRDDWDDLERLAPAAFGDSTSAI